MADENQSYEYELMGVTVHTGTADGGHYYSFICTDMDKQGGDAPESWWVLLTGSIQSKQTGKAEVSYYRPTKFGGKGIFGQGLKRFGDFMVVTSR